MMCEQSREQEELLAAQQKEIDCLKSCEKVPPRQTSTTLRPVALSHSEHGHTPSEHSLGGSPAGGHSLAETPVRRQGKAPPTTP